MRKQVNIYCYALPLIDSWGGWPLAISEIISVMAAIKVPTGSITTYRKRNKPAYGPLGDSLDDCVA